MCSEAHDEEIRQCMNNIQGGELIHALSHTFRGWQLDGRFHLLEETVCYRRMAVPAEYVANFLDNAPFQENKTRISSIIKF